MNLIIALIEAGADLACGETPLRKAAIYDQFKIDVFTTATASENCDKLLERIK